MLYSHSLVPDEHSTGLSSWSFMTLMPQLTAIFLSTFLIMVVAISYNKKLKQEGQLYEPRGLVLLAEIIIKSIEKMIIEILGIRYKSLTVYCLFLLIYIITGNAFAIIGFETQVGSYTVVLSMGIVTFVGIYYFALKYQKLAFFKKFIYNPLELIQQFVPLISITFRLFGNVLGGTIIVGLLYHFLGFIWGHVPILGPVDLLALIFLPFFHIYFDIFDGSIQAYIFTVLTLIYWQSEMTQQTKKQTASEERSYDKTMKKQHKIKKI